MRQEKDPKGKHPGAPRLNAPNMGLIHDTHLYHTTQATARAAAAAAGAAGATATDATVYLF